MLNCKRVVLNFTSCYKKVSVPDEICRRVNGIKAMLRSMDDGEISVSAYDTAWVALVEDINGNGSPQFSSSLQWIVDNQLSDGSWGDYKIFFAHDRIINTLACVVALKYWNIYPERCKRGTNTISFSFFLKHCSKVVIFLFLIDRNFISWREHE